MLDAVMKEKNAKSTRVVKGQKRHAGECRDHFESESWNHLDLRENAWRHRMDACRNVDVHTACKTIGEALTATVNRTSADSCGEQLQDAGANGRRRRSNGDPLPAGAGETSASCWHGQVRDSRTRGWHSDRLFHPPSSPISMCPVSPHPIAT